MSATLEFPGMIEMSVGNWKHYVHLAKTEKHRAEMRARKKRRSERVATDFAAIRAKVNLDRVKNGLRSFRDPVEKYPGAALRAIRASATNWCGEVRR